MIRRPPRSTLDRSSAASDVYKRQLLVAGINVEPGLPVIYDQGTVTGFLGQYTDMVEIFLQKQFKFQPVQFLSLIHISEPTRPY